MASRARGGFYFLSPEYVDINVAGTGRDEMGGRGLMAIGQVLQYLTPSQRKSLEFDIKQYGVDHNTGESPGHSAPHLAWGIMYSMDSIKGYMLQLERSVKNSAQKRQLIAQLKDALRKYKLTLEAHPDIKYFYKKYRSWMIHPNNFNSAVVLDQYTDYFPDSALATLRPRRISPIKTKPRKARKGKKLSAALAAYRNFHPTDNFWQYIERSERRLPNLSYSNLVPGVKVSKVKMGSFNQQWEQEHKKARDAYHNE